MRPSFSIAGDSVAPGNRAEINIPVPALYTHAPISCPVYVVHGKKPGPTLFLSGAIHGDEINGVEIIRRVLNRKSLRRIRGTLVAVPVVNIFGFISQTRYLPDRRDLNRSFPGSDKGSLAARIAHLFIQEVVSKCSHGIDLHTAARHRDNFPQLRANLDDPEIDRMARAFNAPVIINTEIAQGTLRSAAAQLGIPVIVYEAGEALRFDEVAIRAGVRGVMAVMRELEMLPKLKARPLRLRKPYVARASTWVRAHKSGILRASKTLGEKVTRGESLGVISDPFGARDEEVEATHEGIIIGRTNIPLVNEGEALFHIARFDDTPGVVEIVETFQDEMDPATDRKPSPEPPIV
jgi:predicted deacylase